MGNCNGDLRFDKGERLEAESVAGDVRIHDLGDARLGRVRGDLWVEKVRGALQVAKAEGDARLAAIDGPVTLRAITGDLRTNALTGGLVAPQVSGDAVLQGPYGAAGPYSLSAEGDVVLNLPADADARVSVKAGGRIRSETPLTPATDGLGSFTSTLGRGTARINLVSGGDLRIHSGVQGGGGSGRGKARSKGSSDGSDLGERIRAQVNASLAAAGIHVVTGPMTGVGRERLRSPKGPRPSRPQGATTEEQLAVLRMVEEGKITPDEADMLLKALGV
jgi:SHOCT-like domain